MFAEEEVYYVPASNVGVEISPLTVSGDGIFGRWLSHEGWTVMNETRVLMKEVSEGPFHPDTWGEMGPLQTSN